MVAQDVRHCVGNTKTHIKKPLMPSQLPSRPWQKVAIFLCEFEKQNYLVVSDYYSRYLEILNLPATTSSQVVAKLRATFARYSIPEVLVSDEQYDY